MVFVSWKFMLRPPFPHSLDGYGANYTPDFLTFSKKEYMMKKVGELMKIYGAIRTAIYWALTALVFVFVLTLAEIEVLRYAIGGLMIFYGVEEIIHTAVKHEKHYSIHTLYWNIIEMLIGLVLIVFVETGEEEVTYAVVCVCWAIWSILRESRELVEVTEELKAKKPIACKIVAIVNMLESLTVVALSLTMLIEPGEHHAKIHLYLLGVELFTKVLFPILNYIAERVEEKKKLDGQAEPSEVLDSEAAAAEEEQTAEETTEKEQNAEEEKVEQPDPAPQD